MIEPPTVAPPDAGRGGTSDLGGVPPRRSFGPWHAVAFAGCACVAVALIDPTEHLVTPPCPMRTLTGWWCPLCGATRAASKVIRGDFGAAFRYNAMFLVLLPLVAAFWAVWAFPQRFAWLEPLQRKARKVVIAVAIVLVAFTVVRNTPLGSNWLRYPGA